MSNGETIGHGVRFAVGDGADPEVFTNGARVLEYSGISFSRDAVEVTSYESPGKVREFIGGLVDGGEFTLTIALIEAVSTALHAAFSDNVARSIQITMPTGIKLIVPVVITSYEQSSPMDDKQTETITCKVAGQHTWEAAA